MNKTHTQHTIACVPMEALPIFYELQKFSTFLVPHVFF